MTGLGDLAELLARPGPFATVYLNTDPAIENAAQYSERRWRAQRATLADAGAPEAALCAIDAVVPDAHLRGAGTCIVADTQTVVLVDHDAEVPAREYASWSALPSLGPVVAWRHSRVPHVLVLADRRGADLYATRATGDPEEVPVDEVDPFVEKNSPGGWSQRRYQQRAEVAWEKNAAAVADTLTALVERTNARIVAVAGDVRAVELLREHLPKRVDELVREIRGGRAKDGSETEIARETARLVADAAARETVERLEKYREELGQHDRAVEGADATVAALQEARVEVMLVHDDPDDDRRAWFGGAPTALALTREDAEALATDGDEVHEARLVDVSLRAALGTAASVRIVPKHGGPNGGIGAVLRWREAGPVSRDAATS